MHARNRMEKLVQWKKDAVAYLHATINKFSGDNRLMYTLHEEAVRRYQMENAPIVQTDKQRFAHWDEIFAKEAQERW